MMDSASGFTATPLGGPDIPGVLVTGLTPEVIADPLVAERLRALWIDKGLIVFRGLSGTDTHIALSRVFGELTAHPSGVSHNATHPELSDISYTPEDGNLIEIEGRLLGNWLPWHSDMVYFAQINHGGILRALEPTTEGGKTGFIDKIGAWDRLPETLRARIEPLSVVYQADFRFSTARYVQGAKAVRDSAMRTRIIAKRDEFPSVAHPMVCAQPETGRKMVNISPWFAQHVEGMDTSEGMALLDEVVAHITNEAFAYFHFYEKDDMVLWDNWRMLHSATGAPPEQRRVMQRTTILGDYGLGRIVAAPVGSDQVERVSV